MAGSSQPAARRGGAAPVTPPACDREWLAALQQLLEHRLGAGCSGGVHQVLIIERPTLPHPIPQVGLCLEVALLFEQPVIHTRQPVSPTVGPDVLANPAWIPLRSQRVRAAFDAFLDVRLCCT